MGDEERLLWGLGVAAALFWVLSTFKGWWRRWRNNRARKRFEDAARRKWEGHHLGHVAARYRRRDAWLKKIGYPVKGGKPNQG
jgi:hypothetical protein